MDRFLVRKRAADATGGSALNGTKVFEEPGKKLCSTTLDDPQTVISWNVNGLVVQLRNNWSLIKTFLESEQPDVLCLKRSDYQLQDPKVANVPMVRNVVAGRPSATPHKRRQIGTSCRRR